MKHINECLKYYIRGGRKIFPCWPNKKNPRMPGVGGHKKATSDAGVIEAWWDKYPNANIGLRTGIENNLVVVDVDVKNDAGGMESLKQLQDECGQFDTRMVHTPSGGLHYWFKHPGESYFVDDHRGFRDGIDIKADSGYVLAPGSSINGNPYEFEDIDKEIAELPIELLKILTEPKAKTTGFDTPVADFVYGVDDGARDDSMFKLASRHIGLGTPYEEAKNIILTAALNCTPALPEKRALKCLNSAYLRYEPNEAPFNNGSKPNKDPVAILIDYAKSNYELFCDPQNQAYATVVVDKHKETYAVDSAAFQGLLQSWYYRKTKRGLNKTVLDSVLSTISAIARYDGEKKDVHLRVAQIEDIIYIDICNDAWECIQVTPEGWDILYEPPVVFLRSDTMLPLPSPIKDGNIELLLKHINIDKDQLPLVIGWLLMCLQKGNGTYPPLVLNGSAGSGKSTASRMLRKLVDPNKADLLTLSKIDDLRVIATGNHLFAFDNLSSISPAISDALCKIASGDNQTFRELYTTNSAYTVSSKSPILLNGIPELVRRDDLASRSLKLRLNQITSRKTESEAWKLFDIDAPSIFGAMLDGIVCALKHHESVDVEDISRMADFCKWSTAAGLAYGWSSNRFMAAYRKNTESSYMDALDSSTFGSAVYRMFESEKSFEGRPLDLLQHLEVSRFAPESVTRSVNWVSTASGVVNQLDRIKDSLSAAGISYEKYKNRTNKTFVKLTRMPEFGDIEEEEF
jgi:hypothetical protein